MTSERKPTADTPLVEFITRYYMTAPHHRSGKIPNKAVLYRMLRICELLDAVLLRPPLVTDLTAANLHALGEHVGQLLKLRRNTVLHYRDAFKAAWRYAADLGLVPIAQELAKRPFIWNPDHNGNAVKLSADESTLWGICLKKYFPRNIRIRCDETKQQYQYALRDFKQFLRRDPTVNDLTEDNLLGMMAEMRARDRSPKTCNERAGRIIALWRWLAARDRSLPFPTVKRMREPKRIPRAWSRDELTKLLDACQHVGGKIGDVWAADWWIALHLVLWDSGARIGEIRALRWDWIDFATGDAMIPAEYRKGQERDMAYKFHAETLGALAKLRALHPSLVFGEAKQDIYSRYKAIRKSAGLATDRGIGFHKIRRSVASHLHAAGYNATDALGHASAEITRSAYLDPRIVGAPRPSEVLFRVGQAAQSVQLPADAAALIVAVDEPHDLRRLPRAKPLPPEPQADVSPELAWL